MVGKIMRKVTHFLWGKSERELVCENIARNGLKTVDDIKTGNENR